MDPIKVAIAENRLKFFNNGSYKYEPSQAFLVQKQKQFNSHEANLKHKKKLMFINTLGQASRKLQLIENQLEKGKSIKRISQKNYIYN